MSNDIVIVGMGGFGREIQSELKYTQYNFLGFVDDNNTTQDIVIGNTEWLINYPKDLNVLVCIGDTQIREKVVNELLKNENLIFPNMISSDAELDDSVKIGKGNIIYKRVAITVQSELGDFNYINLNSTISHDVKMKNFITVSPGCTVCGNVKIDSCVYIGAGTVIKQGIEIGSNSTVGLGSVVVKDIKSNVVAFGNPCNVKE